MVYFLAGLETSWCPPGGGGGSGQILRKKRLEIPAQTVAPVTRTWISVRKRNETRIFVMIALVLPHFSTQNAFNVSINLPNASITPMICLMALELII